eukprot:gene5285-7346_t
MIVIDFLLQVPTEILSHLLFNWLNSLDLSCFDVAMCNHTYRLNIWRAMSYSDGMTPYDTNIFSLSNLIWLISRNICVNSFIVGNDDWNCFKILMKKTNIKLAETKIAFQRVFNRSIILSLELTSISDGGKCDLFKLSKYFINLESLHFCCKRNKLSDSSIILLSASFTKLRVLSLSRAEKLTDCGLAAILSANFQTLTSLNISYCTSILGLNVPFILFSNLLELEVIGCYNITNEVYILLSSIMPKLMKLTFGTYHGGARLVDGTMISIISNLQNLIHLTINDGNITGEGFISILPSSLTSLEFLTCMHITAQGLTDIFTKNNLTNIKELITPTNFLYHLRCNIEQLINMLEDEKARKIKLLSSKNFIGFF